MKLNWQHCFLHPGRGAVARCPECGRCYCHECITEHDGQVLCRRCLNREAEVELRQQSFFRRHRIFLSSLGKPLFALAGFVLLWLFFVTLGTLLMHFPDSFYEPLRDSQREGR